MHTVSLTSSAVLHGTVDFSTMMAPGFACFATSVITASKDAMSVALPAPMPLDFVGVFTATSTRSASPMHFPTSVEKKRFGSLAGTVISAAGLSH